MLYRKGSDRTIHRSYVVVSDSLPFYEETWKKIEEFVDAKDANSVPSNGASIDENGKSEYKGSVGW